MKKLTVYISVLILLLSCSQNAKSKGDYKEALMVNDKIAIDESESTKAEDLSIPEKNQTQIIRTGTIRFETNSVEESYQKIKKALIKYNGSLQNDESGKDYSSTFRNIIVRIPNNNFISFLDEISQGITYFDKKEISSQDVTEQYIDLESRMNSKKTLEKRYLQLLSKANKVSEIIEIEAKLAEIREEIEAKEGQFRYLKNQIAMSTFTIEMYTNDASQSGETASYGSKIGNAIKSGCNELSGLLLQIISIWPFIIISILIFIFIKRKIKKKIS